MKERKRFREISGSHKDVADFFLMETIALSCDILILVYIYIYTHIYTYIHIVFIYIYIYIYTGSGRKT